MISTGFIPAAKPTVSKHPVKAANCNFITRLLCKTLTSKFYISCIILCIYCIV